MFGNLSYGQTFGTEHNRYMDYLYEACKVKSTEDPQFLYDKEKIATLLFSKSVDFFQTSEFVKDKSNLDEKVAGAILSAFGEDNFNLQNYNYSEKQQKHMRSILGVFDKNLNFDQAITEFNTIDANAKKELNRKEYEVIHSVVDIAIHSSEYAYENINKWQNLSTNEQIASRKIDWGAVVKADVKGFLTGLFTATPLEKAAISSLVELLMQCFF